MSDIPQLIPLPGGAVARLRDPKDLTVRHTRPYSIIMAAIGPDIIERIMNAQATKDASAEGGVNNEEAFTRLLGELGLGYRESELLIQMNDAVIFKWLESWSGVKKPLPQSPLDVPNMGEDLYQALQMACAKREAEYRAVTIHDQFQVGPATIEDHESPTGASAG